MIGPMFINLVLVYDAARALAISFFIPLAIVIATILFVPFRITLKAVFDGKLAGDLVITWMWGFAVVKYNRVPKEIIALLGGRRILLFRKKPVGNRRREHFKRRSHLTAEMVSSFMQHIPLLISLVRKIYRSFSPSGQVNLALGFGNPAETGLCVGILAAGLATIPFPIHIEPDFERERYLAEGILFFRIVIGSLIFILLGFLLSRRGTTFLISCIKGGRKNGTCEDAD
jgi:Protein of unknown function (DUF2953)